MLRILLIWLGKLIQLSSRIKGNAGSALPGLVVERLVPGWLAKTAKKLKHGAVVVTGTNGKTTTTKIIADVLTKLGHRVIVNRSGSNMSRGIISTLIEHSNWYGGLRGDIGVFEVDEAFVPDVTARLKPRAMVVLNLLRDQLDRYGELDRAAELIKQGMPHAKLTLLNADDSLVTKLAQTQDSRRVRFFGASDRLRQRLPDDQSLLGKFKTEAKHIHNVHKPSSVTLTSAKQLEARQQLEFTYAGKIHQTVLPLDGIYNAYNAAAALAVCAALKADFSKASSYLSAVIPAFGRTERIELADHKAVELLLVKNPAGFNQIITTFLSRRPKLAILMALNDKFADGRDVSWIWDVDIEMLNGRDHEIITTGTRAADLALRLKYAGVKTLSEDSLKRALEDFLANLKPNETGYIVPTYTAMLALRRMLAKQADIREIWR